MKDAVWNVFELLVNIYESLIIFHFVCGYLEFDINKHKNKIIYISAFLYMLR